MKTSISATSLLLAVAAWGFLGNQTNVSAEATMDIKPAQQSCSGARGPFEIFASGLTPSKDVLVDMVVGDSVAGSVGGRSEPDGRFYSPIPMVLMPCTGGGTVTAVLRIEGSAVAQATFEVLAPGVQPSPPAAGDSSPDQPAGGDDWMFVSAIVAGSLLITLLLLLAGPKREPRDGSLRGSSNRPGPD